MNSDLMVDLRFVPTDIEWIRSLCYRAADEIEKLDSARMQVIQKLETELKRLIAVSSAYEQTALQVEKFNEAQFFLGEVAAYEKIWQQLQLLKNS